MSLIDEFRRVTKLSQKMLSDVLTLGDSAIDATMGTGEDTCFLAKCVGSEGCVYGFDIQSKAVNMTKLKLEKKELLNQSKLYCAGHETMGAIPEIKNDPRIRGIMFNLGYLPHGDARVFTQVETTLEAVRNAALLLSPKGVMTICLYKHPEGIVESRAVEHFCGQLKEGFNVYKIETINKNNPPYLIVVEKSK